MYCPNCGKEIAEDARFCPFCGYRVISVSKDTNTSSGHSHNKSGSSHSSKTSKQKWHQNRKGIIILILCCAFAIMIIAFFFTSHNQKRNESVSVMDTTVTDKESGQTINVYQTNEENIKNDEASGITYVNNEVILSVPANISYEEVQTAAKSYGGMIIGCNDYTCTYQIQLDEEYSYEEIEEIGADLKTMLNADSAIPNIYIDLKLDAYYPDDSFWDGEWSETPGGKNWGVEAIRAPEMWEYYFDTEHSAVNVGILDNQFYTKHEDLNFTETWLNENASVVNSHGTHVAGIIGAEFNNSTGIAGVAPDLNLYGASMDGLGSRNVQTNIEGESVYAYEAGLCYLIGQKECRALNLSCGSGKTWNEGMTVASQLQRCLKTLLSDGYDFLLVKACGNDCKNYSEYDLFTYIDDSDVASHIITVGAAELGTDGEIYIADYSNYGNEVDIIAPGTDIYSTEVEDMSPFTLFDWSWGWTYSTYRKGNGTSYAAPFVTGTAAAMFSVNSGLTGAEAKEILISTAQGDYCYKNAEGLNESVTKNEQSHSSPQYSYHYPLVDAYEAVKAADGWAGETDDIAAAESDETVIYQAYLDLLVENQAAINSYNWQKGLLADGTPDTNHVTRAVSFADVYGDDTPELIYMRYTGSKDGLKLSELQIVTYEDSTLKTLYTNDYLDTALEAGGYYYFFQKDGDKTLYLLDGMGSDSFVLTFSQFSEGTDGMLAPKEICKCSIGYDEYYKVHDQEVSETTYEENVQTLTDNISKVIMYGADSVSGSWYPDIYVDTYMLENGCTAMTCTEAISDLRGLLGVQDTEKVNLSDVYQTYLNFVEMDYPSGDENSEYQLIYIDNDDIPELWINSAVMASGAKICTYSEGKVEYSYADVDGYFKYLEKGGMFYTSGGRLGGYYDEVYSLKDGVFTLEDSGTYHSVDEDYTSGNYTYEWNNESVSKEQYANNLEAAFDFSDAIDIQDTARYDYESFCRYLESLL